MEIVKFISFPDKVGFMPCYNPLEMMEMGVFQDNAVSRNYYHELGFHDLQKWNTRAYYPIDPNWNAYNWFIWYKQFYKGIRQEDDDFMIGTWMAELLNRYQSIPLKEDKTIADGYKQGLLELGWNYKYKPLHEQWTIEKYLEKK